MAKLYYHFIHKEELEEHDITAMYQMIEMYYENVNPTRFLRVLAGKDYVFFVRDGNICAFTTLQVIHIIRKKQKLKGLLLGDVVASERYGNDDRIEHIFADAVIEYRKRKKKTEEKYIFANCKDYKAYKMFASSFSHVYPCQKEDTPKHLKKVINAFREHYCNQGFDVAFFQGVENQAERCDMVCIAECVDTNMIPTV